MHEYPCQHLVILKETPVLPKALGLILFFTGNSNVFVLPSQAVKAPLSTLRFRLIVRVGEGDGVDTSTATSIPSDPSTQHWEPWY